jgi:hypothetical protein
MILIGWIGLLLVSFIWFASDVDPGGDAAKWRELRPSIVRKMPIVALLPLGVIGLVFLAIAGRKDSKHEQLSRTIPS